jgi:hypothetical protein
VHLMFVVISCNRVNASAGTGSRRNFEIVKNEGSSRLRHDCSVLHAAIDMASRQRKAWVRSMGDMFPIFEAAMRVEPSIAVVRHWYLETPIHSLGGRCAAERVCDGEVADVLAFLNSIDQFQRSNSTTAPSYEPCDYARASEGAV